VAYILRRRKLGRTSCRKVSEFSETGIRKYRSDRFRPMEHPTNYVFRWGCTEPVGPGIVINQTEAIHRVNDKRGFRLLMNETGLCPKTWTQATVNEITLPCVIRPPRHHQGRHLFVCNSHNDIAYATQRCGADWYASPLINKVAEFRIFIVQGRCVCVAKKFPANPGDVAWNVARGGRFENVNWDQWPLKAVRIGIEAFTLSGLDFGGVDVMVDAAGDCFVLEINSAPSLTSPYRQKCFARAFDYIVRHGKDHIPLKPEKGDWKKFIHPAIVAHPVVNDIGVNPRGG
jgi:hypothetical protein